ncbi:MAG: hypothetical protein ACRDJF_09945 [Actinomycetota bacterium]
MPCTACGRRQTDPVRGPSPWACLVIGGQQSLVCPECQTRQPGWLERADRCPRCTSTRLSVMLGSVVCRNCGGDFEPGIPTLAGG